VSLNSIPFGDTRAKGLRFTKDAAALAVPGFADAGTTGGAECFAHYDAPGTVVPPATSLSVDCATLAADPRGFEVRPEGGPIYYYQSGASSLVSGEIVGTGISAVSSITPVHATHQLLAAFGGRLLLSIADGSVASYDVAADGTTLSPNDTLALATGPDSAVLLPCPGLFPAPPGAVSATSPTGLATLAGLLAATAALALRARRARAA